MSPIRKGPCLVGKYKRRLEIAVTNEPAYNTAILIITKKVLQQNTGGPG
jgi:hypothetical protein